VVDSVVMLLTGFLTVDKTVVCRGGFKTESSLATLPERPPPPYHPSPFLCRHLP